MQPLKAFLTRNRVPRYATAVFMSTKPPPSDLPTYSFATAKNLEAFLEREHSTAPGFYLQLAKKASGMQSVSAAEAVETALCFGWIDGRAHALDKDWWLVRYTPRRAKSLWSQKNVSTATQLLAQNRMRPAGRAAVEAAKADGRWERAYAGPATMTVPEDLNAALGAVPAAKRFFDGLNRTERYSALLRVQNGSPAGRVKRIESLVLLLAEGRWPATSTTAKKREKEPVDATGSTEKQDEKPAAKRRRRGLRSDAAA
ncbi:uncharacterized protein N7459_007903 [Penicillium hispanicum]|uniref:uncharacterized protein n=1 Tax=Penicillium hispanicum TaxID=1080232 RepID=UPI002542654C|nr:uncharacterized protein N7459_007903 [Penicillium hispanicum]KAJ5573476.1 hypothetical protein N7459_007903 [Penicillium hispanicum]